MHASALRVGTCMPKYKVWRSNHEQWDPNNIDPHTEIEAHTVEDAAAKFADRNYDDSECEVIVLAPDGDYFEIVMHRTWSTSECWKTTLEELCRP